MSSVLVLAALLILAFLALSRRRRSSPSPRGMTAGKLRSTIAAVSGLIGAIATSLVDLLAASAEAMETEKDSDVAPSGGVFNYRTGKLDDGTDPVGWYEED